MAEGIISVGSTKIFYCKQEVLPYLLPGNGRKKFVWNLPIFSIVFSLSSIFSSPIFFSLVVFILAFHCFILQSLFQKDMVINFLSPSYFFLPVFGKALRMKKLTLVLTVYTLVIALITNSSLAQAAKTTQRVDRKLYTDYSGKHKIFQFYRNIGFIIMQLPSV